mgnify:CR=1 FL=1
MAQRMEILARCAGEAGVSLTGGQLDQFETYYQELAQWNQRLNLTRHVDYDTFVARDVVDSMQLAEFLVGGETVLDIGSGGGVPGMLLAILRPDVSMTLCDAVKKKTNAPDLQSHVSESSRSPDHWST